MNHDAHELRLFFCFSVDLYLLDKIKKSKSSVQHLLFEESDLSLQQITYQHQLYLGKFVSSPFETSQLDNLKNHLISLINQINEDPKPLSLKFYLIAQSS